MYMSDIHVHHDCVRNRFDAYITSSIGTINSIRTGTVCIYVYMYMLCSVTYRRASYSNSNFSKMDSNSGTVGGVIDKIPLKSINIWFQLMFIHGLLDVLMIMLISGCCMFSAASEHAYGCNNYLSVPDIWHSTLFMNSNIMDANEIFMQGCVTISNLVYINCTHSQAEKRLIMIFLSCCYRSTAAARVKSLDDGELQKKTQNGNFGQFIYMSTETLNRIVKECIVTVRL